MIRPFILLCFAIAIPLGSASAQRKISLTIEQALQTGKEYNKTLHMSRFKKDAAEAKAAETRTLALPTLRVSGVYTRLSDVPPQAIILPANAFGPGFPPADVSMTMSPTILNNYTLRATLQQPLWTGGKISGAIDAAEYNAQAAREDQRKDEADVVLSIQITYWGLYRAIQFRRFVEDNVAQIRAHVTDAENLRNQGVITDNDVMKVRVQLSDALVRKIDAENAATMAAYALNNVIGLPIQTEVELASSVDERDRSWNESDALVARALEQRPEVLGMNARVQAGEAGITAARGGWWPQIALAANYNYLRPNTRFFPVKDEFKDTWDLSLSVSFDIWNWRLASHQTSQAQAQLAQVREGLAAMKDGITLEVLQSRLAIRKAKERIAVSREGLRQAEENYRVTKDKFSQGLVLNSDLLDAELALLQSRLTLTQSLVEYEIAIAQLTKATAE
jgi:outer membrane protein